MLSKNSFNKDFSKCLEISNKFIKINKQLKSKQYWAIRSEVCLNLFLWHLNEFKNKRDPRQHFIQAFKEAIEILEIRKKK